MTEQNLSVYSVERLMEQTRKLAYDYYKLTGKALPVSSALACYDVQRLLNFKVPLDNLNGVDLIGVDRWQDIPVQVKSRVLFAGQKSRPMLGQLNFAGEWQATLLVILKNNYQPEKIIWLDKETLVKQNKEVHNNKKRLSIAKCCAFGETIWEVH